MSKLLVFLLLFCNWPLYSIIYQLCDMKVVNVGGVGEGGGGGSPPPEKLSSLSQTTGCIKKKVIELQRAIIRELLGV